MRTIIILLLASISLNLLGQDSIAMVRDLKNNGAGVSVDGLKNSKVLNNKIFYFGRDNASVNTDVVVSDGTFGGTRVVKSPFPTATTSISFSNKVLPCAVFNNKFIYDAKYDNSIGRELYQTTDQDSSISLFYDFTNNSSNGDADMLLNVGNKLIVNAKTNSSGSSYRLHVFDTSGLDTIFQNFYCDAQPILHLGRAVYPGMFTNVIGVTYGLLIIDSNLNTSWVPMQGSGHNRHPYNLISADSNIYFTAGTAFHGVEPYIYKWGASSCTLLKNIASGTAHSYPHFLGYVNGNMVFAAVNSGKNLYSYNESQDSVYLIKTGILYINVDDEGVLLGNNLLFAFRESTYGHELWKTDGTDSGTVLVKDIRTEASWQMTDIDVKHLFYFDSSVYFQATDGTHGYELWRSDGTASGTNMVFDLYSGAQSSSPQSFVVLNDELYFAAFPSSTINYELCKLVKGDIPVSIDLGKDTTICKGSSFYLTTGLPVATYRSVWNSADTGAYYYPDSAGTYIVKVYNRADTNTVVATDTIVVTIENVDFRIHSDTTFYVKGVLETNQCCSVIWYNGSTADTILVDSSYSYSAIYISSRGCFYRDTVDVIVIPKLVIPDYKAACKGESIIIQSNISSSEVYQVWSTGDTSSFIMPTQSGIYTLKLYSKNGVLLDSQTCEVIVEDYTFSLGNDTLVYGDSLILKPDLIDGAYVWSDQSTNNNLLIKFNGAYWLEFTSELGCVYRDTISVNFSDKLQVNDYYVFCPKDTPRISSNLDYRFKHLWSTGDTTISIVVPNSGIYKLVISDRNNTKLDSVSVEVLLENLNFSIGNDTLVYANSYTIKSNQSEGAYKWDNNTENDTRIVDHSGVFWVHYISEMGCEYNDTVTVALSEKLEIGNDKTYCFGETAQIESNLGLGYLHVWSTGDTALIISPEISGTYWVDILDYNGTIIDSDSIDIIVENIAFSLGNDTIVSDTIFTIKPNYVEGFFTWQDGSNEATYTTKLNGTFIANFTSINGCMYSDTVSVTLKPKTSSLLALERNSVQLFPNPSTDKIHIKTSTVFDKFQITNNIGKIEIEGGFLENIDISLLPAGTYFINLYQLDNVFTTNLFVKK